MEVWNIFIMQRKTDYLENRIYGIRYAKEKEVGMCKIGPTPKEQLT